MSSQDQHIPRSLALAKETAEEIQAGTLFERLRSVGRVTEEILREARGAKNHTIALQAIGRIERQLELEARLLGELDDSARVAIGIQVSSVPDLSHLTDEQLAEEVRILRETKAQLDALHAGKPAQRVLEAAPGSVLQSDGDDITCITDKNAGSGDETTP